MLGWVLKVVTHHYKRWFVCPLIAKPVKMTKEFFFNSKTINRDSVSNAPVPNATATERVSRALAIPNQISGDLQALDEKVKSMMERSQNMIPAGTNNGKPKQATAFICKMCGKEGRVHHIRDHIEANHLDGISIPCDYCDKAFTARVYLTMHKSKFHK